jgi:general secretion pathway protein G
MGDEARRLGDERCAAPRGFTLIELMVVVVIVSILLALIVPAIQRARIAANEARVVAEINQLGAAISAFKAKYGVEPPSQFSIYLTQAGWNGNPAAMALVKRIWPQFDFSMGTGAGTTYPLFWQTIAASQPNNAVNFNSGEALLFFLGGVIDQQGAGQVPRGFAKNPIYPFAPFSVSPNREGPFFEFSDINRIKDFDGNGINEWYDPLPNQLKPYLYFSAYEGRGYSLAELPVTGGNPPTAYLFIHDFYRVSSVAPSATTYPPATPTFNAGVPVASQSQTLPAQKPQSWQIISPGYDGDFGFGGIFNPSLQNSGLFDSNGNPDVAAYDNLTNFNGGRLNP